MKQYSAVYKWFQHAKKILIVGSKNWNQDHTAAMSALEQFLTLEGKKVTLVNQTPAEKSLKFLPAVKSIKPTIGHKNDFVLSIDTSDKSMANLHHIVRDGRVEIVIRGDENAFSMNDISFKKSAEHFDLIVTIGATDLESLGEPYLQNRKTFSQTPIVNISNDIETENFGKLNVIEPGESSICEILYKILDQNKVSISPDMATTILTGIISQSDSFLSANTSANGLRMAGKLQSIGANQSKIIDNLYKEKSFNDLRTLGRILNNLSLSTSHRMAWSVLKQSDFKTLGTTEIDIDHWSDQVLRHTKNTDLFVLFVEQEDGQILAQVRTKTEGITLNEISQNFENTTNTRFGINILSNESVENLKSQVLKTLQTRQETRLNLETNEMILAKIVLPESITNVAKKVKTKTSANSSIPFELGS